MYRVRLEDGSLDFDHERLKTLASLSVRLHRCSRPLLILAAHESRGQYQSSSSFTTFPRISRVFSGGRSMGFGLTAMRRASLASLLRRCESTACFARGTRSWRGDANRDAVKWWDLAVSPGMRPEGAKAVVLAMRARESAMSSALRDEAIAEDICGSVTKPRLANLVWDLNP
eukprot:2786242-Rhodomonas_salina.1